MEPESSLASALFFDGKSDPDMPAAIMAALKGARKTSDVDLRPHRQVALSVLAQAVAAQAVDALFQTVRTLLCAQGYVPCDEEECRVEALARPVATLRKRFSLMVPSTTEDVLVLSLKVGIRLGTGQASLGDICGFGSVHGAPADDLPYVFGSVDYASPVPHKQAMASDVEQLSAWWAQQLPALSAREAHQAFAAKFVADLGVYLEN